MHKAWKWPSIFEKPFRINADGVSPVRGRCQFRVREKDIQSTRDALLIHLTRFRHRKWSWNIPAESCINLTADARFPETLKGSICIGIRTPSASQITQYIRIKNPLPHFSDIFPRRNILLSKCFFLAKFLCRVLAVGWTLGGNCVMLEAYYPTMRLSTGCGPDNCQSIALCILNEEDLCN